MAAQRDELEQLKRRSVLERITHEFWYRGDLSYMLRKHGQSLCYNHYHRKLEDSTGDLVQLVWNCHRRMGKSFLLVLILIERCLRYPRQEVKFCAPTKQQVTDIIRPLINFILEACPKELRPFKREGATEFHFRNPRWGKEFSEATSVLKLIGVNIGDGDKARGQGADLVALDECGLYRDMDYLINSVLLYQFANRHKPALIMATSAPVSVAHDFYELYVPSAQETEDYMEVRATDNPDFTEQDKRNVLGYCQGGEGSVAWRREALCEKVSDESSLILPEFQSLRTRIVVDEYQRPTFFHPWCSIDTGWVDHTAVLYGYIDFEPQVLVIEHVIWVHYRSKGDIAYMMREVERKLYPDTTLDRMETRVRRVADMDPQGIVDFRTEYGLPIRYVDKGHAMGQFKSSMEANISKLRTGLQEGRLRVLDNKTTEPLIYQALHGVWDADRKKFARPASSARRAEASLLGHCDCLAALAYLFRNANWRENPRKEHLANTDNMFFVDNQKNQQHADLRHVFGVTGKND